MSCKRLDPDQILILCMIECIPPLSALIAVAVPPALICPNVKRKYDSLQAKTSDARVGKLKISVSPKL